MTGKRLILAMVVTSMIVPPGTPLARAQELQTLESSPVSPGSVQYDLYQKNIDRMTMFVRDMRSHLDRTAFDFDALLESLDYDADEIIAFSKLSIAFEQYPGVLRGPLGTLFSRAGNSIDQAIFLAKLLRDAGYEARVAGTELDADQAVAVLTAMKQPIGPPPPIGDANAFLEVIEKYGFIEQGITDEQKAAYTNFVQAERPAIETRAYESVVRASSFIENHLKAEDVMPGAESNTADLIDEAREYYWVQYKDSAADPWMDAHPVFAGDPPFDSPPPSTFIAGEVPESLQHRLRLQVFIERKIGDRLEVLPITSPWERPVANLVGLPLTFSNIANSMLSTDSLGEDLGSLSRAATSYVPTFGSGMAEGASFFDLTGTLVDPMAMSAPPAALFATINSAFGDAIGSIASSEAIPTLTAQWMSIVLISPGGAESSWRRTTFDRIGAAARKAGKAPDGLAPTTADDARTLLQRHTIMIDTGGIPRGFVVDAAGQDFVSSRARIDASIDLRFQRPPRPRSLATVPVGWSGHPVLFNLFDQARTLSASHRNYRSGPAVVIHSEGLGEQANYAESIDIVSNPRRAIDIRPKIPSADARYLIQAGVWETAAEGLLQSGDSELSTWSVFENAGDSGVDAVVLLPGRAKGAIDLSADTLAVVEDELVNGYAVIIPRSEATPGRAGWWRVDLRTGETLGQIGDGRGAELAEYLTGLIISVGFLIYGAAQCQDAAGDGGQMQPEEFCCHMMNGGMALLTMSVGLWLLPVSGVAAVGAGTAMDSISAMQPWTSEICEEITEDDPWE